MDDLRNQDLCALAAIENDTEEYHISTVTENSNITEVRENAVALLLSSKENNIIAGSDEVTLATSLSPSNARIAQV